MVRIFFVHNLNSLQSTSNQRDKARFIFTLTFLFAIYKKLKKPIFDMIKFVC
jgi:hypothetical protein